MTSDIRTETVFFQTSEMNKRSFMAAAQAAGKWPMAPNQFRKFFNQWLRCVCLRAAGYYELPEEGAGEPRANQPRIERKTELLKFRVSPEEKAALAEAALKANLANRHLSKWLRKVALQAAGFETDDPG
jgi:hypothetical protein